MQKQIYIVVTGSRALAPNVLVSSPEHIKIIVHRYLTPEALHCLYNYPWPGNVRELENVVERITILKGSGMITPSDLPEKLTRSFSRGMVPNVDVPDEGLDFDAVVQTFEKQLLTKALEKTQGVKSKAAELLHMNRTTLVEKVKKLRLEA